MPPRHAYWTILVDNQPTAFRAHDAEELLPTLNRLKEKNPSAVMKWFERGKLFDSRDAAREAGGGEGERRWEGPRPERGEGEAERTFGGRGFRGRDAKSGPEGASARDRRDRDWRPGGEHRDPRQKYKDAKKAKWQKFKQNIRQRWEEKQSPESLSPPHGDPLRDEIAPPRPPRARPRAGFDRRGEDRDGRPSRPHGDKYARPKFRGRDDRREWKPPAAPRGERPFRQDNRRGGWQSRPPAGGDWRDRSREDWGGRPRDESRERPRGEWQDRSRGNWSDRGGRDDQRGRGAKRGGFGKKPWSARPPEAPHAESRDRGRGGKSGGFSKKAWGAKPRGKPKAQDGSRPPKRRRDDEE